MSCSPLHDITSVVKVMNSSHGLCGGCSLNPVKLCGHFVLISCFNTLGLMHGMFLRICVNILLCSG